MIIWKKKLIRCCKCGKAYSFDDNLYYHLKEYILVCPNCNLMHEIDISLLGKEYEELKKIDKLDLTAIDVGAEAINRSSYSSYLVTFIGKENPANEDGKITSVETYCYASTAFVTVAIFYRPDPSGYPNNFTARDSQSLGTVSSGHVEHEVDLDVMTGDYIGMYASYKGGLDAAISGEGYWQKSGNQTACNNVEFSFGDNVTLSLKGTGTTPPVEAVDNAVFFSMNF